MALGFKNLMTLLVQSCLPMIWYTTFITWLSCLKLTLYLNEMWSIHVFESTVILVGSKTSDISPWLVGLFFYVNTLPTAKMLTGIKWWKIIVEYTLKKIFFFRLNTPVRERKASSILKGLGRNTDRNALASFIRLFEPMVIQALKVLNTNIYIFTYNAFYILCLVCYLKMSCFLLRLK